MHSFSVISANVATNYCFGGYRMSTLPEPGESCLEFMFLVCTAHCVYVFEQNMNE